MGLLLKISCLVSILEIAYVAAGGSNCVVGNCPCHSKVINLNKPSDPIRNDVSVCCPPTHDEPCSEYFTAGDATEYDIAFCNCDYTKINGTCLRGADQCYGKKESGRLNEMPVCCDDLSDAAFVEYNKNNDTYYCWCAPASPACNCQAEGDCSCNEPLPENDDVLKGTCLRGEQCDGKVIGGDLYGIPLCCKYSDEYISSIGINECECASLDPYAWTGNCIRGNDCYHKEAVGLFHGAPVCCPHIGMTFNGIQYIRGSYHCNCHDRFGY